jgi:MoxR-like ATPase
MSGYVSQVVTHLRQQVGRVIVGQESVLDQVLICLLAEGHGLLEGVPGTAKTLMVKTIARVLGAGFTRIQFTPDLMPADITGTKIFHPGTGEFSLHRGPIFTEILLADEINRTPARTQAALLEAMEERQVTIDGERHPLAPLFLVLATQNPIEYEGTYPLPEAQLDRFLLKILIDYPTEEEEREVLAHWQAGFDARQLGDVELDVLRDETVLPRCRKLVREVRVESSIQQYMVTIVRRTRELQSLRWGASPRAAVALLLASRALAAIRGRAFVTPDDVRDIALPVLRHRLLLHSEAELDGLTADDVLTDLLQTLEIPR